ncbi:unnamed protein product [Sphenostylis stenocarpa]|uniref:Uncharacterized protein n=1 Tax=Sphenostylis stenocarpa TaxID=92480 RepID=A0AA86S4N1_9FABA|nr:unnamed protein product [Sphenostylis stenocarpa]
MRHGEMFSRNAYQISHSRKSMTSLQSCKWLDCRRVPLRCIAVIMYSSGKLGRELVCQSQNFA